MPTSFREYVDLASAIKGILDNYPFGNALLREILQNSDDAGARHQKFVLDTRQHPTISLADSTLSKTQGPALLCFNDTVFSESDWQALLTIHGSNKRSEDHKTGKYGLGFRSCYHITDNPHILSADKLAIFDPHYEFGAQPGGMQIRLSEAPQYSDQFQAFHPYFSASTSYYDGTIIRLPLRTSEQRAIHHIRDEAFSPQSIRVLFENFIRDELKMVLLFLKNVATIELHEINEDGVIHWATASVENIHAIATDRGFSRGNDERLVSFRCIIDYHVRYSPVLRHSWRICHSILSAAETTRIMSDQLGFAVGNRLDEEKLFSHVAVAYPLDKPLDTGEGRLFTLLPLPIPTGFPLHAHGIFALMPDRQSLKNPNERGHTTESRENFLVQWNNSIFDVFLPKIWVHLLSILATEDSVDSLWPVFPTPTNDVYLRKLPDAVFNQISKRALPVLPHWNLQRNFVSSTNALAVLDNEDNKILDAMATASVAIFQPPLSLVSLFQTQCETGRVTKLTPLSLRLALLQQRTKLQTLNKAARIHLLEYLVVTPGGGVEFIRDLPLLPTVTGTFVACSPSVSPSQAHLLVSEAAGSLFRKTEPSMIALWMLPPNVQTILCNPQTCQLVGLAPLRPTDLPRLLNPLFGISLHTGSNISLESSGLPASWFADFWTWAVIENIEIPPSIGSSFLIPIAPGDLLRRPDAGLMSKTSLEESHRHTLERAGVPFVDSTQAIDERYLDQIPIDVVRPASDISFVLNQIQVNRVLPEHCESLRQYFCIHAVAAPPLMQDQMDIFKSLSIFPIMKPDHIGVLFDKIDGDMIFLTDKSSLIPRVASTTFVDVSLDQPAKNLACLLQPNAFSVAFDEIELLAWSIPHLSIQPPNILDSLLRRLVSRAGDLGSALESLHQQPVIPVRDGSRKIAALVIDPSSVIAPLFEGEQDRFLSVEFTETGFLGLLQNWRLVQSNMTVSILEERITVYGTSGYEQSSKKALALLQLLDRSWQDSFTPSLQSRIAWLPANGVMYPASDCRPKSLEDYLYDLVLPVLQVDIRSEKLLMALGWHLPPTDEVLIEQLRRAISRIPLNDPKNEQRIQKLLCELAPHSLSLDTIDQLQAAVADVNWIPLDSKRYVSNRYALLERDHHLHRAGPFRQLPSFYTDDPAILQLLELLGCSMNPSTTVLLAALVSLSNGSTPPVSEIIRLLDELSYRNLSEIECRQLLVPGPNQKLFPLSKLVYKDTPSLQPPADFLFCHSSVSEELATRLHIIFSSTLAFGNDDEDRDDIEMEEDLSRRIGQLLTGYTIEYAVNEFIANAVDAGATTFEMALDSRKFGSLSLDLPKAMQDALTAPALLIYNDATFSEADFRGLREVGKGGKGENPDTIGRFGLGALTQFHFSDLPMVISAGSVMMLDPLKEYLPPRGNHRRTVLYRKLSSARHLGLLTPVDGLWGFDSREDNFSGTIFRLPLRTSPSKAETSLAGPIHFSNVVNLLLNNYKQLCHSSLIFTPLKSVSAADISPKGEVTYTWVFNATRKSLSYQPGCVAKTVAISPGLASNSVDTWLVTTMASPTDAIPLQHQPILGQHKLARTGLRVGIAFQLHISPYIREGRIFSSLMLPVEIALPGHIDAPFAISSDRRNLRFDAIDVTGKHVPEAAYNYWLIKEPLSELYLLALHVFCTVLRNGAKDSNSEYYQCWPFENKVKDDLVSRELRASFKEKLLSSPHALFLTASGAAISTRNGIFSVSEPKEVRKVLQRLQVGNFVPGNRTLRQWFRELSLQHVTGEFVASALTHSKDNFLRLCDPGISALPVVSGLDFDTILQYILSEHSETPGLPLLRLERTILPLCFNAVNIPIYYTSAELPDLVPTGQLLDRVLYTKDTLELLFESSLDVHRLSADVLTSFMSQWLPYGDRLSLTQDQERRLATFWNLRLRKLIPDVADVPGFLDLPLFPTLIGADHVSLQTVRRSGLIADLADHTTLSLAPILDRLDLVLIREDKIYQDLLHVEKISLKALIKKIHPSELAQLDLESRHTLSQWLRSRVSSLTEESTLIQMRRLPLWMCSRGGTEEVTEFVSADSLTVVPRTLNLSLLRPYLSANVWYIEEAACHGINHLDVNGPSITYLTPSTLVLGLVLPRQLRVEETGPFVSVLRAVIDFAESSTLQHISVPREDLQMVQPRQLYSFSVELFRQCFRGPRHSTPPFLHQQFLRFEPKFIESAQLQHDITYEAFLECAQSVSQALDNVSDNEVEVPFLERSHALFAYYNNNLPNQLMSSEQEWARLARFRFIPRAAFRRRSNVEGTSLESGCRILPRIVSPHDLVLPDFESVCWSQLARFEPDNLPTPNLIILNQKLGHPTCHNVVEHLKFLALHAAPSYPHALWLLNDLKATYHWLQNNLEQCSPLLAANSAEKLFLNADNPSLDSWVWRGADSLIFDLAYDIPRENIFAVHSFLTNNFRALLNAAGAKTIHDPDLMPLDYSGPVGSADLKSMFSQMWQKGELLDLEFVPLDTRNSIAAVADPGINSLRGHRAFIAACVPHLLESLQSGMRESLSFQYYLDETTAFVASKVIEFLYTEKITLPVVPQDDNGDFAGALFVDVLEILPLADRWEMESLKDYLALLLKESGLITPDSHDRAREEARKFSATRLEDYCVRYGERNSSVLNRLSIAFDGN